ncbi:MAG: hypothetical protein RL038_712 [Actinomycetota bacterium]
MSFVGDELFGEFNRRFDAEPEVWASAPGRVNIIGEHIDYSDGWVLPFAINYRTNVLMRRNGSSEFRLASGSGSMTSVRVEADATGKWTDYVVGVLRELGVAAGLDIYVSGDVPNGAGLSSSAALECAVATAVNALFGFEKSAAELALVAQAAENNFVGMPCGIMDQAVSMMAIAEHALLLDCRTLDTTAVPLELGKADLILLVIDTRAKHELVDGGYAERRAACESVVQLLGIPSLREADAQLLKVNAAVLGDVRYRRARHAVTEMQRVHDAVTAMRAGDFAALGRLITASHASLRDDYEVSCAELDIAVEAAIAVGALGARMVGGGFGGSAIALVRSGLVGQVQSAVRDAYAAAGFKEPRFFVAQAADGARVEFLDK